MIKQAKAKPHKVDGAWYLVRRVPKEFAELDRRGLVRISTGIAIVDDPRAIRAGKIIEQLDNELSAYWRGIRDGRSGEARLRFEAAQARARALSLPYMTNQELADGPTDDIIKRIRLLLDRNAVEDELEVAAVLGGEERPTLRLSGLVDEFKALEQQSVLSMSPNQQKRWKNPRARAVNDLIAIAGDLEIRALTRANAMAYREMWQKRIKTEGLDIGSANKAIGVISKMLATVDRAHQLGLPPVFKQLRLSGGVYQQRDAFDISYVQDVLLKDRALEGLNIEARHLLMLIADTGLRLSEAANLQAPTILLDHAIPHVQVRANGRLLKTPHSMRDIPLVGCALAVMKLHPNGFPRYRDNNGSLSATVNKFLERHGLLPSDNHSLYSLRHTFEDRLTAVETPEKIVAELMGHKWIRPKYGAGPTLEHKREWLLKIAFKPPAHL
ncbi:tyrosine-type recombinase/integrase [Mesorhizobium sp. M0317]|uniref:tyrosine-type recombinase/integrase n=1 Tax=Mesorhizobium sp. M0317 TaxID=2956935 RepID=UPI00333BF42F